MSIVNFLSPVNLDSEREKFLNSRTYNPILEYPRTKEWIENLILEYPDQSGFIKYIVEGKTADLSELAASVFSVAIEDDNLKLANNILKSKVHPNDDYDLDGLSDRFKIALDYLNIDYSIRIVDEDGFNVRPKSSIRTVVISKYANLAYLGEEGLVKHEITHIIRAENGIHNNISFNYACMPTEEGFASYMQDYYGSNGRASLYQHAAEYAATEVGLKGSMRDVFDFFRELGFGKQLAWQRAIRHKFGFTDTSKPGDIMKPAMYFYHERKVKVLSEDELWRLFVGKIRIEDLDKYPSYKGKIPIGKIKEFYRG